MEPRSRSRLTAGAVAASAFAALVVTGTAAGAVRSVRAILQPGTTVAGVVDGNTVDVVTDGRTTRVDLVNVAAPHGSGAGDPAPCLARRATESLRAMLPVGSDVTLQYDVDRTDDHGRTLAAVYKDGRLVNADVARTGLAVPVPHGGNRHFLPAIDAAFAEARSARRGVLDPRVPCTVPGRVAAVQAWARRSAGSAPERSSPARTSALDVARSSPAPAAAPSSGGQDRLGRPDDAQGGTPTPAPAGNGGAPTDDRSDRRHGAGRGPSSGTAPSWQADLRSTRRPPTAARPDQERPPAQGRRPAPVPQDDRRASPRPGPDTAPHRAPAPRTGQHVQAVRPDPATAAPAPHRSAPDRR